jgi:hypothetical protein
VTLQTTIDIITTLKNCKAQDIHGLMAEHLKLAHPTVHHLITILLNRILQESVLPDPLRHGLVTPVYKQKKSAKNPDNYRRITVVPIIGKLIEKLLVKPTKPLLSERISGLQRGFCDNSSSINTALLLSEAISEAKDRNIPLYVAFLDATKAFDVVWHKSLLCKIHSLGVDGDLWAMYNNMYKQLSSQVKCHGVLSRSFMEKQGVRQGGIPSTELFKARGDDLLQTISRSCLGFTVGTIDVAAPTCADDIALISDNPITLQALLNLAVYDAHNERYEYSATKSKIMVVNNNTKSRSWTSASPWELDGRILEVTEQETHLGIQRTSNGRAQKSVESNIQRARRASYALVGIGLHGINGLHIRVNLQLWNCYILPRLVYGLEVLPPSDPGNGDLDAYQRQTLRKLLHLPQGTATSGLYLILGQLPVSDVLSRNILTLFINIARNPGTVEHNMINRQLALKNVTSCSWINTVKALVTRYDLPSIYQLFMNPPSKHMWKRMLRQNIASHVTCRLRLEASRKTTLRYLNVEACNPGQLHPSLASVANSPRDIVRGCVKIRLLLGQYRLQADIARQSGGKPTCLSCKQGPEDLFHVVFACPMLTDLYATFRQSIEPVDPSGRVLTLIDSSWESALQLIIDCSKLLPEADLNLIYRIESLTRNYFYAVHSRRATIQGTSPTTQ